MNRHQKEEESLFDFPPELIKKPESQGLKETWQLARQRGAKQFVHSAVAKYKAWKGNEKDLNFMSEDESRHEAAMRQLITANPPPTFRQIFELNYGGQLPIPPEKRSQFLHYLDRPVNLGWADIADKAFAFKKRSIKFGEKLRYQELFGSALIHEVTHMLTPKKGGHDSKRSKRQISGEDCILEDHFGPEMNAVLALNETPEERTKRVNAVKPTIENDNNITEKNYIFDKEEIIARMHEIASAFYQNNGWFPQTKAELYCVMAASGFVCPNSIKESIHNSISQIRSEKPFIVDRLAWDSTRFDGNWLIRMVNEELSPQQRKAFWEDVAPVCTGDVLDVLGHINGREAMEVPHQDTAVLELKRALLGIDNKKEIPASTLDALAKNLPEEDAGDLFHHCFGSLGGKYDDAAKSIAVHHPKAMDIGNAYQHPLIQAIGYESEDWVDFLLERGCNPNDKAISHRSDTILAEAVQDKLILATELYSARKKAAGIVLKLLDHGGDPSVKHSGWSGTLDDWARVEGFKDLRDLATTWFEEKDERPEKLVRPVLRINSVHYGFGAYQKVDGPVPSPGEKAA